MEVNIQTLYGCPISDDSGLIVPENKLQEKRLEQIKNVLTVREFEQLDIGFIIRMNSDKLKVYVDILNKILMNKCLDVDEKVSNPITDDSIDVDKIIESAKGLKNNN